MKAAEILMITQPTVIRAIRELEDHYGTRFFEHTSQRLKITDEGKAFLEYATNLLGLYDDAEQVLQDPAAKGTLRIGASVSVGIYYIPALIRDFNRKFPNVTVQVRVNKTEAVEKMLLEHQLDLAIVGDVIRSEMIRVISLFVENHIAVCAPDHSLADQTVTLQQFLEQPLLFHERNSGAFESFSMAVSQAGYTAEPAWESSSTEALLEAVRCSLGVTVLPERLAKEEIRHGNMSRIYLSDFTFRSNVCLAYHKNKYISSVMRYFIETAKRNTD